jgi:hypothetical protein
MIAAAPLARMHRRQSRLLLREHPESNEKGTLSVRGVSQLTRSRPSPVESIVVVGTDMGGWE